MIIHTGKYMTKWTWNNATIIIFHYNNTQPTPTPATHRTAAQFQANVLNAYSVIGYIIRIYLYNKKAS